MAAPAVLHSPIPHLYEIGDERDILSIWLEETGGELTPELDALLGDLAGAAEQKIERVALYIRELIAHAEVVKAEEQRLAQRRKGYEHAADSLKAYLQVQMERLGIDRVRGQLATVAIQQNSQPAVSFLGDPEAAYAEHGVYFAERVETVEYKLNRAALIQTWKAGGELPDGVVIEAGSHLRIR